MSRKKSLDLRANFIVTKEKNREWTPINADENRRIRAHSWLSGLIRVLYCFERFEREPHSSPGVCNSIVGRTRWLSGVGEVEANSSMATLFNVNERRNHFPSTFLTHISLVLEIVFDSTDVDLNCYARELSQIKMRVESSKLSDTGAVDRNANLNAT